MGRCSDYRAAGGETARRPGRTAESSSRCTFMYRYTRRMSSTYRDTTRHGATARDRDGQVSILDNGNGSFHATVRHTTPQNCEYRVFRLTITSPQTHISHELPCQRRRCAQSAAQAGTLQPDDDRQVCPPRVRPGGNHPGTGGADGQAGREADEGAEEPMSSSLAPHGLAEVQVEDVQSRAGGDAQAAWNIVIAAYLDGHISLGRTAAFIALRGH